jgi:SLAP domain-containing protein
LQKLSFEPAWDRTLGQKDREIIKKVFTETDHKNRSGIKTVVIRSAFNHKEELLVTVIIHNYENAAVSLHDKNVSYSLDGRTIGEMQSSYTLEIPPLTSMPWTFIFPKGHYEAELAGYREELTIENKVGNQD